LSSKAVGTWRHLELTPKKLRVTCPAAQLGQSPTKLIGIANDAHARRPKIAVLMPTIRALIKGPRQPDLSSVGRIKLS
jgi:hypothetical protein